MSQRQSFVETVTRLMETDEKLVLLLGDISIWAFREAFEKYPTRCYNLGVTEQASVGLAAGLAMSGFYPIYHTIDSFMVRRAYEFIRLDFGEQKLKGLFVSVGADDDYRKLGPTHMCPEGPLLMSQIPGMDVHRPPVNFVEFYIGRMIRAIYDRDLAYIRLNEKNRG